MPEDRDPALDPTSERGDRLFPPDASGGAERGVRRQAPVDDGGDDDRLFPPRDGGEGRPTGDDTADASAPGGPADPPATPDAAATPDGPATPDGTSTADGPDAAATSDGRGADGGANADDASGSQGASGSDDGSGTASGAGPPARGRPRGANSFIRELPVLLLIAFVLAFVLRTFIVQVFYIPSGSMEPTLQVDDRMVVEKITYRFREPARGEVAVFEGKSFGEVDPSATAGERFVRGVGQFLGLVPASARDFVKRVIGLPGDEILIEEGVVFVNGEPLDEPYVVFEDPTDFGPITVPDGQLFFLGDNRPNSSDSRRSLGYVPLDQVVGRAAYVIWPPDNAASLMGTDYLDVADGS